MRIFQTSTLIENQRQAGQPWFEFLRTASLSMGLYHLRAGQSDPQQPHAEDELYYVVSGRGSFEAGDERQSVGPGTLFFVERCVEHRFCDIAEDLIVLVFFAPPEGSRREPRSPDIA